LAEGFEPVWISGTSAGAVNAVALAAGLAAGGPAAAREKLRDVWTAVAKAAAPDLLRMIPLLAGMQRSGALARMTAVFSPYDLNPLGFDPLRKVLESHIDFSLLRTTRGPELLIAATDIATGRARLFRRAETTVEAVLASACLPTIHHAVEIEGRAYWDGGYSANPELITLALDSPVHDTLIVQLSPLLKPGLPTSARDITAHVAHVTFNQPYVRDLDLIVAAREREAARSTWWPRAETSDRRLARHRFHLIDSGRFTSALAPDSKVRPELALLTYLFDAGSDETAKWIERNRASIGLRDTAEIARRLADARSRVIGAARN
jgi:NTE family protein